MFQERYFEFSHLCRHYGLDSIANYWEQVLSINQWQKKRISNLVVEKLFGTVTGKKILLLGFAFKANTNDTRESPAIEISKNLIENGAHLNINDPKVNIKQIEQELSIKEFEENPLSHGRWNFEKDIYKSATNADAIIIITEWQEYRELNWQRLSSLMRKPAWIFDTRKIVPKDNLIELGINFWQVEAQIFKK